MNSIDDNFYSNTPVFDKKNNLFRKLKLGLVGVFYALGKLASRSVVWIQHCLKTTKKTNTVALKNLSSNDYASSTDHLKKFIEPIRTLSITSSVKASFAAFTVELEEEILPIYQKHETGFDSARVHGRMHVARAVIFCEVMARYYQAKGVSVDLDYVRRTTGLHDAGREGNGTDLWEKESAALLCQHLISKNIPSHEARQKSQIIMKDKANQAAIEFIIFQSADCLDIMRPCTGNGGREGFKTKLLTFLKGSHAAERQFQKSLIEEAWFFIQITEAQKMTDFNESKGFMDKLLGVIRTHQDRLPILSSIL